MEKNEEKRLRKLRAIFEEKLTPKERLILECLGKGYKYREFVEEGIAKQSDVTKVIDKAKRAGIDPRKGLVSEWNTELVLYMTALRNKTITKKELNNSVHKIENLVQQLGNRVQDMVFLARMYAYLGRYTQSEATFNTIKRNNKSFTAIEARVLTIGERECIEAQYRDGIYQLLKTGCNSDTIISETLKRVPKEKRQYVNLKFIVNTIKEFEKNNDIKSQDDDISK